MRLTSKTLSVLMFFLFAGIASAQTLALTGGWVRLLPGNLPNGAYFTLQNNGDQAVTLVGASAPGYGSVMLHKSIHRNGTEQMIHVKSVRVAPGDKLTFAPGGYHIMLMHPHNHLKPGDKLPVTLIFASGEKMTRDFDVRSATGQ